MPLDITYKTKTIEEPQGFTCDVCGEYYPFEYEVDSKLDNLSGYPNLFHAKHTFGYGSPEDGATVEMTICEKCLLEFCKNHSIPINYGG